jgi:hypothetical protein
MYQPQSSIRACRPGSAEKPKDGCMELPFAHGKRYIAATADYGTLNALKRRKQLPVHLETWTPRNDAIGEMGGAQVYTLPHDKNDIVI